jgi:hypothetical protein
MGGLPHRIFLLLICGRKAQNGNAVKKQVQERVERVERVERSQAIQGT